MDWFIQLHRHILEWEWYNDDKIFRLFLHCLLKANWKDKKWRWEIIKRWSFITSLDSLSKETGLSIQNVRTVLNKLKLTDELTKESHASFTLIKVNNYEKYQSTNTEDNNQLTNDQQTTNKQLTTTNKDNNINKDNKVNNNIEKTKVFTLKTYIERDIDIDSFIEDYDSSLDYIKKNLRDFYLHWSEKKINWKKEKWEMEKTFDVNRRFHKWLSNSAKWWNNTLNSKDVWWIRVI